MLAEVELVAADAGQGAGRGADFSGEVWKGGDVVSDDGGGVGQLGAGELHSVSGVAREPNHDVVQRYNLDLLAFLTRFSRRWCAHRSRCS